MRTKTIAAVEIAIVLCSLFLVALPATAIAAEQNQEMQKISTTASEDDYVLGIYGNANEDDTIDMRDVTYTKLVIFGKKPETELADAYYDDEVDVLDVVQIKLIILGRESELTIVDSAERIVTVNKPIERVIPLNTNILETMRSIKAKDKVIAIETYYTERDAIFFAEFSDYPKVGSCFDPDIEAVLELKPDVVLWYPSYCTSKKEIIDTLESVGTVVLGFDCYKPDTYMEEVEKLGYLFETDEAEKFIDFHQEYMNSIKEQVEGLSEEERPSVYWESLVKPYGTAGAKSGYNQKIWIAGGNNIFGDKPYTTFDVDPEEVITRNPEFIVKTSNIGGYGLDDTTGLKEVRDEIMDRSELATITAVENGDVYVMYERIMGGARHFICIGYMAKWFHPNLFSDLDPQAIHQEYLTRFQGLDIDLDEKGVFVYPEPS